MRGFYGTHQESLYITTFHGSLIILDGSDPLTLPYFAQCFEQISLIRTEVARVNVWQVSLDQSVFDGSRGVNLVGNGSSFA